MDAHEWRRTTHPTCVGCSSYLKNKSTGSRFCSVQCATDYRHNTFISRWLAGEITGMRGEGGVSVHIRIWLFQKHRNSCQECGWSKIHPITGKIPLTVNHKDGNWADNRPDNLELLCPNCHSLTSNYGSLNKGKGRPKRLSAS
jgi:hypothetical protein